MRESCCYALGSQSSARCPSLDTRGERRLSAMWHYCTMPYGRIPMTATEYVVDVLGGAGVFKGRTLPTSTELRARIKRGLPYRSLESVRGRLRLSASETATVLHMPARTLARRRQTRTLDADESDRLY